MLMCLQECDVDNNYCTVVSCEHKQLSAGVLIRSGDWLQGVGAGAGGGGEAGALPQAGERPARRSVSGGDPLAAPGAPDTG